MIGRERTAGWQEQGGSGQGKYGGVKWAGREIMAEGQMGRQGENGRVARAGGEWAG